MQTTSNETAPLSAAATSVADMAFALGEIWGEHYASKASLRECAKVHACFGKGFVYDGDALFGVIVSIWSGNDSPERSDFEEFGDRWLPDGVDLDDIDVTVVASFLDGAVGAI